MCGKHDSPAYFNRSKFFKRLPDDPDKENEDLIEQDKDESDAEFEDYTDEEKPLSSKTCKIELVTILTSWYVILTSFTDCDTINAI